MRISDFETGLADDSRENITVIAQTTPSTPRTINNDEADLQIVDENPSHISDRDSNGRPRRIPHPRKIFDP